MVVVVVVVVMFVVVVVFVAIGVVVVAFATTTAATPTNLKLIDNDPVDTLSENISVLVSKTPTTSALRGANTTFVPTAAAP
jgi:hypothetical protein